MPNTGNKFYLQHFSLWRLDPREFVPCLKYPLLVLKRFVPVLLSMAAQGRLLPAPMNRIEWSGPP